MTNNFLQEIVAYKKDLIKKKKVFFNTLRDKVQDEPHSRYRLFKKAISVDGKINLIAEIKKASPSKGIIRQDFSIQSLARAYVDSGAVALSVLTEDKYFAGKPPYVRDVSDHFNIPVLTKDFILDEMQVFETFSFGSSAILLIVAILSDKELKHLMKTASNLDLDCLVEVHDDDELKRALDVGAEIVGVNNRNLKTFEVDLGVSEKLIPMIPKDKVIVAESGIKTHQDIKMLSDLGVNAVLIGETFLRSFDVKQKVQEVMYG